MVQMTSDCLDFWRGQKFDEACGYRGISRFDDELLAICTRSFVLRDARSRQCRRRSGHQFAQDLEYGSLMVQQGYWGKAK